jgi:hypothetical protein
MGKPLEEVSAIAVDQAQRRAANDRFSPEAALRERSRLKRGTSSGGSGRGSRR